MADFKSILLTLDDDAFFELIRNYLGPIRTPFNKHDLIGQLISFLRHDATRKRIISMIDHPDAQVLTAIWLLDEPLHEELFAFLQSDHSFLELHNHVLNLEDRLLIFRDGDRIRLNPELAPLMLSQVIHPSRLFRAQPARLTGPGTWVDDVLLVSFFSLLVEEPELYRADGTLRKRSMADISRRMPTLLEAVSAPDEPPMLRIDVLTDALVGLGLIIEDRPRLRPNINAWRRWARLLPMDRIAQIAGSGATAQEGERSDTVSSAAAIMTSMPEGLAMDHTSIARLASAAAAVPVDSALKTVRALHRMGLLREEAGLLVRTWPVDAPMVGKPLIIQPNFEITLPFETDFPSALFVAEVGRLVRHDRYPRFELTKDRVATAMRGGIGASHLAERLTDLADGHLPENVAISIRTWEEEFQSIRLHRGVVLQVEERRRHIVDHSPEIQNLVVEEIVPGVYLVEESDVGALQDALRDAGVELVPELPPADPDGLVSTLESGRHSATNARMNRVTRILAESVATAPPELGARSELQERLSRALEKKQLAPEQRQELAERIKRKLILAEDQLRTGMLKAEKTEARGLDYTGKVRVVEQSLSSGGFLEVVERTSDGTPRRRLVHPSVLRRDGTELILEGEELPTRTQFTVPVSKLGLVRRLRATLFTRPPTD